jgi:hypothetical protein
MIEVERSYAVSVIGGGWSFGVVDHRKVPGVVIAVNDALLYLRRSIDHVVSMDRLWTEGRQANLEARRLPTWLRNGTTKNVRWDPASEPDKWVRMYGCDHESAIFSEDPARLNGRNSGACALNLAWLMQPAELFLFGFDMCLGPNKVAHWYPQYPWTASPKGGTGARSYQAWAEDFEIYKVAFEKHRTNVFNVSPSSAITAFHKVSAEDIGCRL